MTLRGTPPKNAKARLWASSTSHFTPRADNLSVGAVTALATVVAAKLLTAGWGVPETVLSTHSFCSAFGTLSGLLVVFGGSRRLWRRLAP